MEIVYLNGQFVNQDKAFVSVYDQGFLYGDGIYESFRSTNTNLYQFYQHYKRLLLSARSLNYNIEITQKELEKILTDLQEKNGVKNGYFRIVVTRGKGHIGFKRSITHNLTWLIMIKEFEGFEQNLYTEGICLKLAAIRRNAPEAINPKIKSISNLNSLLGKLEARELGVIEVIMLNNKEHICEGAASNIFWVKDKYVFTPAASTGLLEGVTRLTIIRLCEKKMNLRVIAGEYKIQDLKFADEVFITSTSLEVMPVVKIDEFKINQGKVGPISSRLRQELHKDMNSLEC